MSTPLLSFLETLDKYPNAIDLLTYALTDHFNDQEAYRDAETGDWPQDTFNYASASAASSYSNSFYNHSSSSSNDQSFITNLANTNPVTYSHTMHPMQSHTPPEPLNVSKKARLQKKSQNEVTMTKIDYFKADNDTLQNEINNTRIAVDGLRKQITDAESLENDRIRMSVCMTDLAL